MISETSLPHRSAPRRSCTARVGVVSDTHGHLPQSALAALRGCTHVLHAGDIGDPQILATLAQIAPVTAVRGNVDRDPWARLLPETVTLTVAGVRLILIHNQLLLAGNPLDEGAQVVVCGHTHRPQSERRGGVLYFNPGSAGAPRHCPTASVGVLTVRAGKVRGRIVPLAAGIR